MNMWKRFLVKIADISIDFDSLHNVLVYESDFLTHFWKFFSTYWRLVMEFLHDIFAGMIYSLLIEVDLQEVENSTP